MLRIYVDAATKGNPGPSGGGILYIASDDHKHLHLDLGIVSNHEAEFKVLLVAIKLVLNNQQHQHTVILHSDSKVVSQTIAKNYTGNPVFQPYLEEFQRLEQHFTLLLVKWVPEKQNKGADQLARQALKKYYPIDKSKKKKTP
ncbi:ribonuclease HI family protein [Enterococcus faecalis]